MRHLIFDTETTDLITNSLIDERWQPRIIEFYGCVINNEFEIQDELEFLCNPGIEIPELITKITTITNEDISDEPDFSFFAGRVKEIVESSDIVVAHNLSYDIQILDFAFERVGMDLNWPRKKICTVEQTEWIKGYRLNLSSLHEVLFGEEFSGAHRAKVDVQALIRCYSELISRGDL